MTIINNHIVDYLNKRRTYSDINFFNKVKPLLDGMSVSNGCKYYGKIKKKIGIVSDNFLFKSYEGIADIKYITYKNYREHSDIDVFIAVSTWRGLNNEWSGLAYRDKDKMRNRIFEIINFYRSNGVKIVFYSKEDPTNYDLFVPIAKKCDYIFTTALECIDSYKRDCNNQNVYLLEFGANPLFHNPIGSRSDLILDGFLFAGSWYKKYPKRNRDMTMLFDGIISSNKDLKIIDRNYRIKTSDAYFYPEKYLKNISPRIDHEYLLKLHRLFDWTVNLNTIQYSSTMYASRVYYLQAIGNLILSNYSIGVNNKFPNVFLVDRESEIKRILDSLTDEEILMHQNEGIRSVMGGETTFHRLEYLLNTIGEDIHLVNRKVLVVADSLDAETKISFARQSYRDKELISITDFNKKLKEDYDIIAFWGKGNCYQEYYLEDMINAFKYTACDYITKDTYYNGSNLIKGIEHDYVNTMSDKYRTLFWSESFSFEQLCKLCVNQRIQNGYSTDRFEYNTLLPAPSRESRTNQNYKLSVIIPVFNNGSHLYNKCFNSLKRSSMFKDMEIIIVDDGSTDNQTQDIIKRIARHNSNVKYYFFQDGGSGSASRPRNKGFELSTANFITYLDPDNEAINDGYFKLFNSINNTDYDMIIGNIIKISDKRALLNYYRKGYDVITNTRFYLRTSKFKTQSIQALIVKRDVIQKNDLTMVPGALGQDSLFFQELFLNSKKVKVINEDIHIYYAAVEGSMTNQITKSFFQKYMLLEPERHNRLKHYGLLKEYLASRFEFYFEKWYLEKFKRVIDSDIEESAEILYKIYKIYRPNGYAKSQKIRKFLSLMHNKKYSEIKKMLLQN